MKRILKWTCAVVVLIGVAFFYWNLTLEVETDKFNETIAAEQKVLNVEKSKRAFQRSQVDRIVNAISNIPAPIMTNVYQVIYIYPIYEVPEVKTNSL